MPNLVFRQIRNNDIQRIRQYIGQNNNQVNKIKDIYNNTMLHVAVQFNKPLIVSYLLEMNSDVTLLNIYNEDPVDIAIKNQNKEIIQLFSSHKVNKIQEIVDELKNEVLESRSETTILKNNVLEARAETTILKNNVLEARAETTILKNDGKRLRETNEQLEHTTKKLKKDILVYQDLLKKKK
jgi:ankyrin repeat protein